MVSNQPLPAGVSLRHLQAMPDERGTFTEIYRAEWPKAGGQTIQWNAVRTEPGVMRGVRVHLRHEDYLVVLDGLLLVGLRDLRRDSPTYGAAALVELRGGDLCSLTIPPGVAHGLYSPERAIFVLGVTHYYDLADEVACSWDDPELGIPWPFTSAKVSPVDDKGLSVSEVTEIVGRSM